MNALTPYLLWIKFGMGLGALVGLYMWGHHNGSDSVQRDWDKDHAAQQLVIIKQQADVIAERAARIGAEQHAEGIHEQALLDNDRITQSFIGRLRDLTAALHASTMPRPVEHPDAVQGGSGGAGQAGADESSAARLLATSQTAESACLRAYADWKAILAVEPKK